MSCIPMVIFETQVLPNNWPDALYLTGHCLALVAFWPYIFYAIVLIAGNAFNIISSLGVVILLLGQ